MALEIEFADLTGGSDYVNVVNSVGQWYNGSTFEAFNASNWATYKIAATEFGASGVYAATMPVVAAGTYNVTARRQAGGSPAQTDTIIGSGVIRWSGTVVETAATVAAAWGSSVVGNGRTRDYFLQGGCNKIEFDAAGTAFTVFQTDDTATLYTGISTRNATTVGPLRSVDPV